MGTPIVRAAELNRPIRRRRVEGHLQLAPSSDNVVANIRHGGAILKNAYPYGCPCKTGPVGGESETKASLVGGRQGRKLQAKDLS